MNEYLLHLDEYEIVNLLAALNSAMGGDGQRTPLYVLNSGDWIGQVAQKLEKICPGTKVRPNRTAEQYAEAARKFV